MNGLTDINPTVSAVATLYRLSVVILRWLPLFIPLAAIADSTPSGWRSATPAPPAAETGGADVPAKRFRVAIIIDDIGYHLRNGLRAANFPAALTLAVIPHSPNGSRLARAGHQAGKEIILHLPMSNNRDLPLDPGALTEGMDYADFSATLLDDLKAIPHISGVNNHMGSRLTRYHRPMNWLMSTLKQKGLYFIDSRTSAESLAWEVALAHELPSLKRDVFLDSHRDTEHISAQFQRLIDIAKTRGYAVAIGHPYHQTLNILGRKLAFMESEGIELVTISQLLGQIGARVE